MATVRNRSNIERESPPRMLILMGEPARGKGSKDPFGPKRGGMQIPRPTDGCCEYAERAWPTPRGRRLFPEHGRRVATARQAAWGVSTPGRASQD